jgi:hypothetical protein
MPPGLGENALNNSDFGWALLQISRDYRGETTDNDTLVYVLLFAPVAADVYG